MKKRGLTHDRGQVSWGLDGLGPWTCIHVVPVWLCQTGSDLVPRVGCLGLYLPQGPSGVSCVLSKQTIDHRWAAWGCVYSPWACYAEEVVLGRRQIYLAYCCGCYWGKSTFGYGC